MPLRNTTSIEIFRANQEGILVRVVDLSVKRKSEDP